MESSAVNGRAHLPACSIADPADAAGFTSLGAGKHVLLITDDPDAGGVAHYNHVILCALARQGFRVSCLQSPADNPMIAEQRQLGVIHYWFEYHTGREFARTLTDAGDVLRFCQTERPDMVIFSDCCPVSNLAARQAVLSLRIPYIVVVGFVGAYLARNFAGQLPDLERQYRAAHAVVAVSQENLDLLHAHFRLPRESGQVIHYGRPPRFFAPRDEAIRARLRSELGIDDEAIICFTAARLATVKGFDLQLKAIEHLEKDPTAQRLHFVWAGDGDQRPALEAEIARRKLGARVHVLGHRWDVGEWFNAADIFLLPSRIEGMPLAIMEAMAKGVPVIATAVSGTPEELGDTGRLLADPNVDAARTVAELIVALREWGQDPALRERLGRAGRQRAEAMFREELMIQRTTSVIQSAVSSALPQKGVEQDEGVDSEFQDAIARGEALVRGGQLDAAILQIEAALPIAPNAECAARAQEILDLLRASAAAAESVRAEDADSSFFGPDEVRNIEELVSAYAANPADPKTREPLSALQQGLLQFLPGADHARLERLFAGSFGRVFRLFAGSGFAAEAPGDALQGQIDAIDESLRAGASAADKFDVRALLARMVCAPAHRGMPVMPLQQIPEWLWQDTTEYLFRPPSVLTVVGEAEQYHRHLLLWARDIERRINSAPGDETTLHSATAFFAKANCIPVYLSEANTVELMKRRAAILGFVLRQKGARLDACISRPAKPRTRIRVGFVCLHFGPQTETHVTLPMLQLDRARFEIRLFAVMANPGAIEDHCRSFADVFTVLPKDLGQQVQLIRDAALDVAIIGTNVTAVTNRVVLLALHRLAPLQLATYCSPMTTGMPHVDGYLSGKLNDFDGARAHFSEKVLYGEGAPGCLDYTVEKAGTGRSFDRASLGLRDEEVVFINAASCFKILPELQETWARILAAVPNSRLLLLPFNPNWAAAFPVRQFERRLNEICARHGVEHDRVVMVDSLPSRQDVKALERVGDVYLDTFPFSGSIAVVDPLELGLPTVVRDTNTPRGRMAGSLLRELALPELIATDEQSYIDLAVRLGTDRAFRHSTRQRILEAMARRPRFVNPALYADGLSDLLEFAFVQRIPAADRRARDQSRARRTSGCPAGEPV